MFQKGGQQQIPTNVEFLEPIISDPNEFISIWDTTKTNVCSSGSNQVRSNLELTATDNLNLTDTELQLFLDGIPKNDGDQINVEIDDVINVTVFFRDLENGTHIPNATVQLVGWDNLSETNNQYYNITINANDLEQGITILTIFAEKENYQPQSIQFFVEVVERETELLLFLDSVPMNNGDLIQVEIDEFINVTVYYRDNITKQLLNGATITLIERGNFTETSSHYNITISTNDLDLGITVLTIFAQLDNYQPQTIQFFVEVIERESQLELFLDGVNMTLDPIIEVTIGTILNITVRFTDNQTRLHIADALIQLIGEGIIVNFTENLNQYSIYLNTTNLKIGVNLFTIIAHATDYLVKIINLRITVNRIIGTISREDGDAQIEVYAGEDVLLKIILKDPQNNTIKNATVIYTWAYGQGQLFDPENDGIYEADLVNVPSGTYIITIIAFAGDDYDFENYEITLIVSTPPPFTLSSNAGTPDTDGSFTLTWISSDGANNYSVYRYFSYITEINGSLTPLAEEITDLSLTLSGYSDGTYYFIVVAYNIYGENLSNCVKIDVVITKSLTIIRPDASSSWEINTAQYIYWNSTGSMSNVRIELYNNGVFVMEIISSTPNNGEFYWFVSSGLLDSKNYQIKITYLSDSSVYDNSDYFEIKHSASPPTAIPGYDITFILGTIGIIGVYLTRKKLPRNQEKNNF